MDGSWRCSKRPCRSSHWAPINATRLACERNPAACEVHTLQLSSRTSSSWPEEGPASCSVTRSLVLYDTTGVICGGSDSKFATVTPFRYLLIFTQLTNYYPHRSRQGSSRPLPRCGDSGRRDDFPRYNRRLPNCCLSGLCKFKASLRLTTRLNEALAHTRLSTTQSSSPLSHEVQNGSLYFWCCYRRFPPPC